jgi:hypothetical protein
MQIQHYQRKPLIVEAVQVTNDNIYDVAKWCDGDVRTQHGAGKKKFIQVSVVNPKEPKVMRAMVGMWVLKSDQGFKIFSEPAFRKSWERVGTVGQAMIQAQAATSVAMNGA